MTLTPGAGVWMTKTPRRCVPVWKVTAGCRRDCGADSDTISSWVVLRWWMRCRRRWENKTTERKTRDLSSAVALYVYLLYQVFVNTFPWGDVWVWSIWTPQMCSEVSRWGYDSTPATFRLALKKKKNPTQIKTQLAKFLCNIKSIHKLDKTLGF